MKTCTQCSEIKSFDNFYICGKNKLGEPRYTPKCRSCMSLNHKIKHPRKDKPKKEKEIATPAVCSNRKKIKGYRELYPNHLVDRARSMFKSANRRKDKGTEFDIDLPFILAKLDKGICEVTGIAFNYDKPSGESTNKFAPSIDRIDSSVGYIKNNVRVVVWWYNLMKNDSTDNELLEICQAVVNKHRGE